MPRRAESAGPAPTDEARRTAVAFQRGEPDAIGKVRSYVRRILTYRALRLPPADLPDLEQKVMTELWQAAMRADFDPRAGFWGLVETITARRSIDALRRRRPTVELSDSLADRRRDPLGETLAEEWTRLARRALGRLEPPCRELVELHAVRRLTYREIAPILGKSEGALRVQMHRCVEHARRLLAELAGPGAQKVEGKRR